MLVYWERNQESVLLKVIKRKAGMPSKYYTEGKHIEGFKLQMPVVMLLIGGCLSLQIELSNYHAFENAYKLNILKRSFYQ